MNKVFVSGGSGYIALHCIAKLIKKGFFIKTSLRSMNRRSEVLDSISESMLLLTFSVIKKLVVTLVFLKLILIIPKTLRGRET